MLLKMSFKQSWLSKSTLNDTAQYIGRYFIFNYKNTYGSIYAIMHNFIIYYTSSISFRIQMISFDFIKFIINNNILVINIVVVFLFFTISGVNKKVDIFF